MELSSEAVIRIAPSWFARRSVFGAISSPMRCDNHEVLQGHRSRRCQSENAIRPVRANQPFTTRAYRPAFLRRSVSLAIGPRSFRNLFSSTRSSRNRLAKSLTRTIFAVPGGLVPGMVG
jgi:hypothetical protein